MSNITFVLFSLNEEQRIEYAVRNLRPYGEVLVFDGGSTDKTQEQTERFGGIFITRPPITTAHLETPEMFDFVKKHVKTDWIFWNYADNLLPRPLLEKITELSKNSQYGYVYVPIYTYLWGETKTPCIKARYPCFFKKDYMDFSQNRMHGMGKFTGSPENILRLPDISEYAIRHFSLYDMSKFVTGHLRYANAEALEKHATGKKFSLGYMFGSMGHYFYLFYKRGWRIGVKGLLVTLLYVFFRLMVFVRLYELEHGITLETIEADFVIEKKKLVQAAEEGHNP